jgi:hypothetical protein
MGLVAVRCANVVAGPTVTVHNPGNRTPDRACLAHACGSGHQTVYRKASVRGSPCRLTGMSILRTAHHVTGSVHHTERLRIGMHAGFAAAEPVMPQAPQSLHRVAVHLMERLTPLHFPLKQPTGTRPDTSGWST